MASKKPHIVCIPAALQGHINPMMELAKLLHSKGFHITMVLSEFTVARLAKSMATESPTTLQNLNDFGFETIPDGLPLHHKRGVFQLPDLAISIQGEAPRKALKSVLLRLLDSSNSHPPVSAMISDITMFFSIGVAKELDIPVMSLCTTSACGMLGYMQYDELLKRGLFPLKDESCLTNGFLDTPIDWAPGLIKGTKMKHIPTFIRTTNPDDTMFNFLLETARRCSIVDGLIFNTFYELESNVFEEIKAKIPNIYNIGPLSLLSKQINDQKHLLRLPLRWNMWEEDTSCIEWLDKQSPKSVIYVNYGSLAILTPAQIEEFAWGLANSKHPFLWVIRSGLVEDGLGIVTNDDKYREVIKGRGLISGWCPQEKVLQHPSVAVFLTHCGWNSTLESMSEGVPMICWPFFSEQQINCLYACQEWRIGVEMEEGSVAREDVERVVIEVMEGEKGKEMRDKAIEWKLKAEEATKAGGSSHNSFDKLVKFFM